MSRDTPIPATTLIQCEKGWLQGIPNNAEKIEVGFNDCPFVVDGNISVLNSGQPGSSLPEKGRTHQQSFVQQIKNVIAAIRGEEDVFIPGAEGVRSLKLIEECYRSRALMQMPWLSYDERVRAENLAFQTSGRG
jgi:predicted dehydrogenase